MGRPEKPERTRKAAEPPDDARQKLAQTTAALFERWRQGDVRAAATLFEDFHVALTEIVSRQLGVKLRTKLEVEDVVQEVGVRLLRYEAKPEDGSPERFLGLLRTMAQHVITDLHRRYFGAEKRRHGSEIPIPSDSGIIHDPPQQVVASPSHEFQRTHDVTLARLTLWFIPPVRRDLLALRWWYDVPFADLVQRFQAEETALRMRHLRTTQEFTRVMVKVKGALPALSAEEREDIRQHLGRNAGGTSSIDSRSGSRVSRFAALLVALQHLAVLAGETLHPVDDGWPRSLLDSLPRSGTKSKEMGQELEE